ncbi:MAG TPA: CocE/NonD family hydrolase [Bryobacteraceae bacterium]|nr:CocE/NonD family hydrolase [Bryobacteraceae bacterium]
MRYIFLLFLPAVLWSQGEKVIRRDYTKYEYRIPMRDGKKLFTSVYVPKDASQKWPILMTRTPYSVSPYGEDQYKEDLGPNKHLVKSKYIFVYQDVRGRNMSEGEFVNMTPHKAAKRGTQDIDESTDTYDSIDWLVKHVPNNSGKVCTYGISYPGFYTAAGMIDAHPAHACASPQAPITDWFTGDDFHRNGALYLPHAFNFLARFGKARPEPVVPPKEAIKFAHGTPDGYKFFLQMGPLYNANERYFKDTISFWNDMMKHDTYDEFWQSRNLRPHLQRIKPAVMTVGGWFDTENLYGALQVYGNVEKQSKQTSNLLVMGPWRHGQWARDDGSHLGYVEFDAKTSKYYAKEIEAPFFEFYLKGKGEGKFPKAHVFETGRNQWRQFAAWPPAEARPKSLYFQEGGKLSWEAPGATTGFDEYTSDPAKPVPAINDVAIGMTREHMVDDQRFAATRPDVLVYQTDVLEEDVTVAGPILNSLLVATTGTDADWIVKLIDVFPDDMPGADYDGSKPETRRPPMAGYQMLVRGEVFRGKFRNSFSKPEPFVPGQTAKVEYSMNDIFHTFRRGHRIMVQVQSSWFPIVDRNPQKFLNINEARDSDFQKAVHRVLRQKGAASGITVQVLP